MKIEQRKVYIASDGKEFLDEGEARLYEKELNNTRYYFVNYAPELTERGTFMRSGYIKCKASHSHELWVEHWLYKKFGSRVAFVQGVAPTWNWSYRPVKDIEVDRTNIIATVLERV